MRLVDIVLCFPTIFLILMVIAFLEPSLWNVMAVIGFTSWPGLARLVRGETLSLRERDFILAARGLGLSAPRILLFICSQTWWRPFWCRPRLGWGAPSSRNRPFLFWGSGFNLPGVLGKHFDQREGLPPCGLVAVRFSRCGDFGFRFSPQS
jgi:peptide/nickel transport system permease protein